jgi:hypothetical protein
LRRQVRVGNDWKKPGPGQDIRLQKEHELEPSE